MRRLIPLLSAACLSVAPAATLADIYVYHDTKGGLHFSNAPSRAGYHRFMPEVGKRLRSRWRPVDPERRKKLEPIITDAARRHGVDEALVNAVIHAESSFIVDARSPKGALGLMQLMPATARRHGVWAVFDPRQNVEGGVRHLRWLLDRYDGDVRLALAAYNAGEGAVDRYGGVPPYRETREYLQRVLRYREQYRQEG